jgi:hypothetical protein
VCLRAACSFRGPFSFSYTLPKWRLLPRLIFPVPHYGFAYTTLDNPLARTNATVFRELTSDLELGGILVRRLLTKGVLLGVLGEFPGCVKKACCCVGDYFMRLAAEVDLWDCQVL